MKEFIMKLFQILADFSVGAKKFVAGAEVTLTDAAAKYHLLAGRVQEVELTVQNAVVEANTLAEQAHVVASNVVAQANTVVAAAVSLEANLAVTAAQIEAVTAEAFKAVSKKA